MTEWTRDGTAWAVIGGCALMVALAVLALHRVRVASRRDVDVALAEAADLRRRLDVLERTVLERTVLERTVLERTVAGQAGAGAIESVVVSTPLDPVTIEHPMIEGGLFADLVLRESVVKAASWAYGVRRALSPEQRNRIAFQMRREVKRARRSRRVEMQEALRTYRARERASGSDSEQGSEDAA